ncbi:LD-carboxypeptidase [Candidatus Symbiobacter mobilis]|uniref:Muramoyltetrapeptide carboxypeptidase n=1 Tax=Candidatus Symbiobacter mobilis CR TaxID=946483 RepID=U5N945_9BURK|nr:LD-carboxypeptidase [Candidatus Symbiobacter mobilis]AGX86783.1 muramoyltetrapeptide carboxypeptidase [Candidatus Symbiobacter mobilis CR]
MNIPEPLQPQQPRPRLYVYSPSSAVVDRNAFRRALSRLERLGYAVEVDPTALARKQRFAGTDADRLAGIHRAAQSGADVALLSRGGYGLTRLLSQLDYGLLAESVARGMRWVGMSDFTALQCALLSQTGVPSWFGPALCEGFGAPRLARSGSRAGLEAIDPGMLRSFQDVVAGRSHGVQWRMQAPLRLPDGIHSMPRHVRIDKATLWGGNLTLLSALVGTPYLPPVDAGILFLEDIGEHPYRIERMCTQLLHAGVLERQQAIVLGKFTGYVLHPQDRGFDLSSVVDWLRSRLSIPILTDLPCGHIPAKVLLPVGRAVCLQARRREAAIFWDGPKTAPHTLP